MEKLLCTLALLGLLTDSATAQQRTTRQKTHKNRKANRSGNSMTDSMNRMNGTMQDNSSPGTDTMRRTRQNRR